MRIVSERDSSVREIAFSGTVEALLSELSINPETVVVVREDVILSAEEEVSDGDTITLLSVVSGG